MYKLIILFLISFLLTQDSFASRISFIGIASHYGKGDGLHGKKTANGEKFNTYALTAAHRTLPFGTKVKVINGNKYVIVRINDRGPFIRGRIIDLSYAAARTINCIGNCKVKLQVIE